MRKTSVALALCVVVGASSAYGGIMSELRAKSATKNLGLTLFNVAPTFDDSQTGKVTIPMNLAEQAIETYAPGLTKNFGANGEVILYETARTMIMDKISPYFDEIRDPNTSLERLSQIESRFNEVIPFIPSYPMTQEEKSDIMNQYATLQKRIKYGHVVDEARATVAEIASYRRPEIGDLEFVPADASMALVRVLGEKSQDKISSILAGPLARQMWLLSRRLGSRSQKGRWLGQMVNVALQHADDSSLQEEAIEQLNSSLPNFHFGYRPDIETALHFFRIIALNTRMPGVREHAVLKLVDRAAADNIYPTSAGESARYTLLAWDAIHDMTQYHPLEANRDRVQEMLKKHFRAIMEHGNPPRDYAELVLSKIRAATNGRF